MTTVPPAPPRGGSAARAGYAPPMALADLGLGVALGIALAGALWWAGHAAAAVVVLLLVAVATSLAAGFPLEHCWIGDDWIGNRRWRRLVVVRAEEITAIRLPYPDVGLSYLVVRSARATVVVDVDELLRRPDLGRAALRVFDAASAHGADVEAGAAAILDAVRARHR